MCLSVVEYAIEHLRTATSYMLINSSYTCRKIRKSTNAANAEKRFRPLPSCKLINVTARVDANTSVKSAELGSRRKILWKHTAESTRTKNRSSVRRAARVFRDGQVWITTWRSTREKRITNAASVSKNSSTWTICATTKEFTVVNGLFRAPSAENRSQYRRRFVGIY